MTGMKVLEPQVREALYNMTVKIHKRDDFSIAHELPLHWHSRRIDMVVANGCLHGFEIKSEADSLSRLSDQISIYKLYMEKITVVCASKFVDKVMNIDPTIGIIEVYQRSNVVKLSVIRNPCFYKLEIEYIVRLLTASELSKVARKNGFNQSKASRRVLEKWAVKQSPQFLREAMLDFMKIRFRSATR